MCSYSNSLGVVGELAEVSVGRAGLQQAALSVTGRSRTTSPGGSGSAAADPSFELRRREGGAREREVCDVGMVEAFAHAG